MKCQRSTPPVLLTSQQMTQFDGCVCDMLWEEGEIVKNIKNIEAKQLNE